MNSFVESWTGRTLLIRLGLDAVQDGDPWSRQVTVKDELDEDGQPVGTIKGYAGEATEEILEVIIRRVNSAWGLPARYLRRRKGRTPYWMRQVAGVDGGKIIMAKQPIPNVSELFNADGSLNESATKHGLSVFFERHGKGEVSISNGKASQTTNGKVTSVNVSFDRTEK